MKRLLFFLFTLASFSIFANDELLRAVKKNDISKVKLLIKNGADVNFAERRDSDTALHIAAHEGYLDMTRLLIRKGAAVNKRNRLNSIPLHNAAWKGHFKIAVLHLSNGADVNARNLYRTTPLIAAASRGHTKLGKVLIKLGGDIRAVSRYGDSVLSASADGGATELFEILASKGLDINAEDNTDKKLTPLMRVARSAWKNPIKYLAATKKLIQLGANVKHRNNNHVSALESAVFGGVASIVEALLINGADPHYVNPKTCRTPVMNLLWPQSSILRPVEVLKVFKNYKVDWAQKDCSRYDGGSNLLILTTLSESRSYNEIMRLDVIKFLINEGLDINSKNEDGKSAIYYSVKNYHKNLVKELLALGADPNYVPASANYRSPLMFAVRFQQQEIVELLLTAGADVNIANKYGETAMHFVAKIDWYFPEIKIEMYKKLIKSGGDLERKTKKGYTVLHDVLESYPSFRDYRRYKMVVDFLLSIGADPNTTDTNGRTVLMLNSNQVVLHLVDYVSNLNVQDNLGNTALIYAAKKGNTRLVDLFISKKVDLDIKNLEGNTALILAFQEGHIEIVKALIDAGATIGPS